MMKNDTPLEKAKIINKHRSIDEHFLIDLGNITDEKITDGGWANFVPTHANVHITEKITNDETKKYLSISLTGEQNNEPSFINYGFVDYDGFSQGERTSKISSIPVDILNAIQFALGYSSFDEFDRITK